MILTLIISIITLLIKIVEVILPNWGLPDSLVNSSAYFLEQVYMWNTYFPIKAFSYSILMVLGFHLIVMTWNFASGLISIIRGGGKINI
jgi:hypothetical protein